MTTTASCRSPWNAPSPSRPQQQQSPRTPPSRAHARRSNGSDHGNSSNMPPFLSKDPRTPLRPPSERPPQESPNYFGLAVDTNRDNFSSAAGGGGGRSRANWGSASSNVRSAAATSPRVVPVDENADFAAFRRQSETSTGAFNLGRLVDFDVLKPHSAAPHMPNSGGSSAAAAAEETSESSTSTPPGSAKKLASPVSPRKSSKGSSRGSSETGAQMQLLQHPPHPKSPKRMLSEDSMNLGDNPRRNSPASFTDRATTQPPGRPKTATPAELAVGGQPASLGRAETLPESHESAGEPVMTTPQHVVSLMKQDGEDILLLDLRVATQYARSRIVGAMNLCIPTTLLKRATFNVQKLMEAFKDEEQRKKFARWRHSRYIVVYDASSTEMKDATTCVNTLKKFEREGWMGTSFIIRGGFHLFAQNFPALVAREGDPTGPAGPLSPGGADPPGTAVIGGMQMPPTKNAANPFFGNIRQNMDLIGGVGQLTVKQPARMPSPAATAVPAWLRRAADAGDNGQTVADKFLQIERREQKRMQQALSGHVSYGTPRHDAAAGTTPGSPASFRVAGIEKGSKNRYNNIWPYEHSRVKLADVRPGGCDYVNANHIRSEKSYRTYIATQAPMPSTFSDFWRTVWEQDVRVIVMLTAEVEGGQVKSHNYWSERAYGPLELRFLSEHRASLEPAKIHRHRRDLLAAAGGRRATNPGPLPRPSPTTPRHSHHRPSPSASLSSSRIPTTTPASTTTPTPTVASPLASPTPTADQPYVIVRKFSLTHAHEPFARVREITQLQYSSWPDFGAPAHPAHLLGLVEQCDAVVRSAAGAGGVGEGSRPVLVHCSAGCGRTGTFCTVDTVVDVLRRRRDRRRAGGEKGKEGTGDVRMRDMAMEGKEGEKGEEEEDDMDEGVDLVERTVEGFRLQRLSMVQSLRQFVLCYESVLEWLADQSLGSG